MCRWLFALLLPTVTLLAACEPDDPCSVAATVEPSMRLGTGETSFTPLHDGDQVEQVWGGQGGSHVWIAYRAEGLVTGQDGVFKPYEPGPSVALSLTSGDGTPIGDGSSQRALHGDETGAEVAGIQLYLWPNEDLELDLSLVTLQADLVDTCGTELTRSVDLRVDGWQ